MAEAARRIALFVAALLVFVSTMARAGGTVSATATQSTQTAPVAAWIIGGATYSGEALVACNAWGAAEVTAGSTYDAYNFTSKTETASGTTLLTCSGTRHPRPGVGCTSDGSNCQTQAISITGNPSCPGGGTRQWNAAGSYNECVTPVTTYSCPTNASGLSGTSCTCDLGFTPNGTATACVVSAACPTLQGQTFAAGYFNMGSDVQTHIAVACGASECEVVYDGATAQEKRIVNGQEQWFAQGLYRYTGNSCVGTTVSAQPAPVAASSPPATNTCAANQDGGTVNGVFKCFDRTTGSVASAASTPSVGTTSKTDKVTNPDGSTTTTTTTTKRDSQGNEVTEKTVVVTNAAGTSSTTTSTTTGTGASLASGGSGSGGCADNPSAAGCGGTPGGYGGQRTAGTDTFAGVLGGLRDQFGATQLGAAVNGFFAVTGTGSCPSWTWHIPVIESDHVVDLFCSAWAATILAAIKLVFLIVVTWHAFRVAVE